MAEMMMQQDSMEDLLKTAMEERKKQLYRHQLPKERKLKNMLLALTKAELDDIRYNLNLQGVSQLKKAELVDCLIPEIVSFSRHWFPTVIEEEQGCFRHLVEKGGMTLEFRDDDVRLDYLKAIGLISCGMTGDKLAWYMPEEILAEYKKLDSGAYHTVVDTNTEAVRLATGLLFYYGVLDFDTLYAKVMALLEAGQREDFSFQDFVGVILNASCWKEVIVALPHGAKYCTLYNEAPIETEQIKSDLDYKELPYDAVYEAGEDGYILATQEYKDLAQFLMRKCGKEVLEAADIVGSAAIMQLNGEPKKSVLEYILTASGAKDEDADILLTLFGAYATTLPLWGRKGHSLREAGEEYLTAEAAKPYRREKKKVGRNDPCPCGSGKKYKNCCLPKDEAD